MSHSKVGCVFAMVVVSILPHAKFGRNDHREDAPHFRIQLFRPILWMLQVHALPMQHWKS